MSNPLFRHLPKNREMFLKAKMKSVHDDMLLRREVYNFNNFDVTFTRNKKQDWYVIAAKIPLGPPVVVCKAGDWLILPHAFYFSQAANGAPVFDMLVNYGDQIGIGNKLASRPE